MILGVDVVGRLIAGPETGCRLVTLSMSSPPGWAGVSLFWAVATFCISLILAFVMGLAIRRGNACMVVAFDDLTSRSSAVRLSTIVSTWLMIPADQIQA